MKNFFLACFFTQTNLLPPRIFYSRKPTYLLLHFYLLMIQKNSNARSVRCSYLNQDEWEAPSFAEACGLRLRERHEASKRRKFHGNMGERERVEKGNKQAVELSAKVWRQRRSRSPVRADEETSPLRYHHPLPPPMVVSEPSLQQLRARYEHIYCPDVATLLLRRSGPMLPWLWPGIELIKADLSEIALPPFFPLFVSIFQSKPSCFFGQSLRSFEVEQHRVLLFFLSPFLLRRIFEFWRRRSPDWRFGSWKKLCKILL